MRALARAKLNLHLRLLAREDSGYHQLETLFCRLELADELEIEAGGDGVRLSIVGPELGPPEQNLVMRAAEAFQRRAGIATGASIHLVKRIPAGAGLGGGSSDAAATLLTLNRLFGEPLDATELAQVGIALGSDIPFFLAETALALAWGRGERLVALEALPRAHVLLAVPPFAIGTADAYRRLDAARAAGDEPVAYLHYLADYRTWATLAARAGNDFEDVVFPDHPLLPALKAALHPEAFLAQLTGSGSAVFGVFHSGSALHTAHDRLRREFPGVALLETATDAGEREDLLG